MYKTYGENICLDHPWKEKYLMEQILREMKYFLRNQNYKEKPGACCLCVMSITYLVSPPALSPQPLGGYFRDCSDYV